MAKFANQKTVEIGPKAPRDQNNLYTKMNLDVLQRAMVDLKGDQFKLWQFFEKNEEKFRIDIGPAIVKQWGIEKDSYYRALAGLEEKGYIVEESGKFVFHEVPVEKNEVENYSWRF